MMGYFRKLLATLAVSALAASPAMAITVGGKNFTEQLLLAEMTSQLLSAHGYDVDKRDGMGTTVLRKAQVNGQIDLYWGYSGTSLVTFNKLNPQEFSPEEAIAKVRELDSQRGLTWLQCSDANNTYALAVDPSDEATADLHTLSDLAAAYNNGNTLVMAVNAEFPYREDGLIGLEQTYGFDVPRSMTETMTSGLTYGALKAGEVDIALVFATDGRIAAFDFRVLKDDKGFFPSYAICPTIRTEVLKANPKLRDILAEMAAVIDDQTMQRLNARVDVDQVRVEDVAREFLTKKGLI